MKVLKLSLFSLAVLLLSYGAFKVSISIIENANAEYVAENPVIAETPVPELTADIDRMMSHPAPGTEETELPVDTEQDYTIDEAQLFVTVNEGETWIPVPDDSYLGYARISDYLGSISRSNIYISGEKVAIAYGGRGSENISVITTDARGQVWSVGSISRTATHDLATGYEELHIDFIDGGQTGYLAAIREDAIGESETLAFCSVNTGVTWDPVSAGDALYGEIMAHFELQVTQDE